MENNHKLKKYHRKLLIESILKSLILGVSAGLVMALICAWIFYLTLFDGMWVIILIAFLTACLVGGLTFYFVYRPTTQNMAARIDEIGLEERIITMVELKDQDSFIAQKQRSDAITHIEKVSPKEVKFKNFFKPLVSFMIIALISIITIVLLAGETQAKIHEINNPPVVELSDEEKIIKALIEELRKIVDEANVSDELKTDLHLLIDALEASIKPEDSLSVKRAKIEVTRLEIIRRIQEELAQKEAETYMIYEALQSRETTEILGLAIEEKSNQLLKETADEFVERFSSLEGQTRIDALLQTADDIELALEESDEENEPLREALLELAELLRRLAQIIEDGDIPEDQAMEEFEEELEEILDQIGDIIQTPTDEEALEDDINDAIDDALDQLNGNTPNDDEEPTDPDDDEEDGEGEGEDEDEEEGNEGESDEEGENGGTKEGENRGHIIDGETLPDHTHLENLLLEFQTQLEDQTLSEEERKILQEFIQFIESLIIEMEEDEA